VDHSLVTRAFANLLNHAVQFSPDGTAVRADIAPAGAGGSHWQVSVRDEGPGIPVSEIDTLFDKFHRSSGDASLRRAGQEFALALVKTVVQGHGGSVVALNVMSHGLETRVCLPAGRRSTR
jgi:K+-sensing histidine kinase KdpD